MLMSAQKEDWVIAIERAGLALAVLARHIELATRSLLCIRVLENHAFCGIRIDLLLLPGARNAFSPN
jgi:hypothetical protein